MLEPEPWLLEPEPWLLGPDLEPKAWLLRLGLVAWTCVSFSYEPFGGSVDLQKPDKTERKGSRKELCWELWQAGG